MSCTQPAHEPEWAYNKGELELHAAKRGGEFHCSKGQGVNFTPPKGRA